MGDPDFLARMADESTRVKNISMRPKGRVLFDSDNLGTDENIMKDSNKDINEKAEGNDAVLDADDDDELSKNTEYLEKLKQSTEKSHKLKLMRSQMA